MIFLHQRKGADVPVKISPRLDVEITLIDIDRRLIFNGTNIAILSCIGYLERATEWPKAERVGRLDMKLLPRKRNGDDTVMKDVLIEKNTRGIHTDPSRSGRRTKDRNLRIGLRHLVNEGGRTELEITEAHKDATYIGKGFELLYEPLRSALRRHRIAVKALEKNRALHKKEKT